MTAPDVIAGSPGRTASPIRKASPGILDLLQANSTLLIAVAFLVAYVRPMLRSLWTDEAGTFWAARLGPVAAAEKIWHWPGQSILYSVITSFFCFPGSPFRDVILRLPALLGAAAACYFLYRFADEVFGAGAGRIAAVLFIFSPPTIEFATQARPYALAMAAAAASCWTLYRWTLHRERAWLAGYVLSVTLVLYLHYMFAVILAAHAALLVWEVIRAQRYWRIGELALGYLTVAASLVPVLPHLALLFHEAHTLPYASKPSVPDLAAILMPSVLIAGAFIAGLLIYFMCPRDRGRGAALSPGVVTMLIVWWVAGPVLFFFVSTTTSAEIFVPRYLSYSGLALVLLLTYAGYSILGSRAGFGWTLLAVLLTTGNPLSLAGPRDPGMDEVGPAIQIIRAESNGLTPAPPVLARSDYTESDFYNWREGNAPESHLYSPFVAYPINNPLLPLPYRLTTPVKDYVVQLINTSLKNQDKVIFITHDVFFIPFMEQRFEEAGFTYRWIKPNNYYVVIFERHKVPVQP